LWRSNTLRVLWPVIFMATVSGTPARLRFRTADERQLEADILEELFTRREGHRYEALRLEGYGADHVESAVYRLWKRGLIDAHSTKRKMVVPSALTTKGIQELQKLGAAIATKGKA
jgi:hypothetical protein